MPGKLLDPLLKDLDPSGMDVQRLMDSVELPHCDLGQAFDFLYYLLA